MKKVYRNGKVAVLYSGRHGLGWFSENRRFPQILFHPIFVELVENNRQNEITKELVEKILKTEMYVTTLGAKNLEIEWVKVGTKFRIDEYDGLESVIYEQNDTWVIA